MAKKFYLTNKDFYDECAKNTFHRSKDFDIEIMVDKYLEVYKNQIEKNIENNSYHILQTKILEKSLGKLVVDNSFDFSATDRDANLDIPYID